MQSTGSQGGTLQPMQTGGQQAPGAGAAAQMISPSKEDQWLAAQRTNQMAMWFEDRRVNTATLCCTGQQTVQDIVAKTQDTFKYLKDLQLPNGANVSTQMCAERRDKVAETLTHLQQLAKRLRLVYLKVIHDARHLDDQSELVQSVEGILPMEREDCTVGGVAPTMNEHIPYETQERQERIEQVQAKNRELKEVIDMLRLIIWEINTMLDMRKV